MNTPPKYTDDELIAMMERGEAPDTSPKKTTKNKNKKKKKKAKTSDESTSTTV